MGWHEDNKHRIANTLGSFLVNITMGLVLMWLCMGLACFSMALKHRFLQEKNKVLEARKQNAAVQHKSIQKWNMHVYGR